MQVDIKTAAETWQRLLEAGLTTLRETALWADAQIAAVDTPPYWLIEVSMARGVRDAVAALKNAEGKADETAVWRSLARASKAVLEREPDRDSEIAKYLYYLGMQDGAPALGTPGELMSFWDAIDLARDGVYGIHSAERERLRAFLNRALDETPAERGVAADGATPRR
jgi:hypothetical protein